MSSFSRRTAMGGALGLLAAPAILHAQPAGGVKIGLVAVQTGPQAALGSQLRDGFLMGLRHLNGRLGCLTAETVMIDDGSAPMPGLPPLPGAAAILSSSPLPTIMIRCMP